MAETEVIEVPPGVVAVARAWWLLLVVGLLCVAAGIVVIAQPDISLATLAVITGIFLVIDGIFDIFSSLPRSSEHRGLLALLGILTVVVGVVLIRHPSTGVVAVSLLIGIWLIVYGLVRFVEAFSFESRGVWSVLVALIEVIAGVVIVAIPSIGVATLAVLVAIAFILRGLVLCVMAWGLHSAKVALSG